MQKRDKNDILVLLPLPSTLRPLLEIPQWILCLLPSLTLGGWMKSPVYRVRTASTPDFLRAPI